MEVSAHKDDVLDDPNYPSFGYFLMNPYITNLANYLKMVSPEKDLNGKVTEETFEVA